MHYMMFAFLFVCVTPYLANSYAYAFPVKKVVSKDSVLTENFGETAPQFARRAGRPLENFIRNYRQLYTAMEPFVKKLVTTYRSCLNKVLYDVPEILLVLPPDDDAFQTENIDSILQKFYYVEQPLQIILDHASEYIIDYYQPWFKEESKDLGYKLSVALFSALSLPFDGDYNSWVKIVNCDGCTNLGPRRGLNTAVVTKLIDLSYYLLYKKIPPAQG